MCPFGVLASDSSFSPCQCWNIPRYTNIPVYLLHMPESTPHWLAKWLYAHLRVLMPLWLICTHHMHSIPLVVHTLSLLLRYAFVWCPVTSPLCFVCVLSLIRPPPTPLALSKSMHPCFISPYIYLYMLTIDTISSIFQPRHWSNIEKASVFKYVLYFVCFLSFQLITLEKKPLIHWIYEELDKEEIPTWKRIANIL